MLTFFRKIRQRLLTNDLPNGQKGKFSKYLIYAIGEIALVVIGILIALQINTWNTNKQNGKLEQQYINRLINELKEDVIKYKKLSEGFNSIGMSVSRVQQILKNDAKPIKDTLQFIDDFIFSSGSGPWHKEPVIWTQLVQSGELKLLNDQQMIEALFKHYALVKRTADNYSQYPTQTTNEARELITTSFADSDFSSMAFGRRSRDKIPPKDWFITIRRNKNEYKKIFVRINVIVGLHKNLMLQLANSAENTMGYLEKNVKDD